MDIWEVEINYIKSATDRTYIILYILNIYTNILYIHIYIYIYIHH